MKQAVSSPAVSSCAGKLFVIGGGPDDDTCSDKVGETDVFPARAVHLHTHPEKSRGWSPHPPSNLFSVITPLRLKGLFNFK